MFIEKLEITGLAEMPSGKLFIPLEKVNIFTGKCTGYSRAVIKAFTLLFNGTKVTKEDFAAPEEESGKLEIEINAAIVFKQISTDFPDTLVIPELFHLLQVSNDGDVFCTLRFSAALQDDEISVQHNWILPGNLLLNARPAELFKVLPITEEIIAEKQQDGEDFFFPIYIQNFPEEEVPANQLPMLAQFIKSAPPVSQIIIAANAKDILSAVPLEVIQICNGTPLPVKLSNYLFPENAKTASFIRKLLEDFPEIYSARMLVLSSCSSAKVVLPIFAKALGVDWKKNQVLILPVPLEYTGYCRFIFQELRIPALSLLELRHGEAYGGFHRIAALLHQGETAGLIWPENPDGTPFDPEKLLLRTSNMDEENNWRQWLEFYWKVYFSAPESFDREIFNAFPEFYLSLLPDIQLSTPPDDVELDLFFREIFTHGEDQIIHRMVLNQIPQEVLQENCPAICRNIICRSIELLKRI